MLALQDSKIFGLLYTRYPIFSILCSVSTSLYFQLSYFVFSIFQPPKFGHPAFFRRSGFLTKFCILFKIQVIKKIVVRNIFTAHRNILPNFLNNVLLWLHKISDCLKHSDLFKTMFTAIQILFTCSNLVASQVFQNITPCMLINRHHSYAWRERSNLYSWDILRLRTRQSSQNLQDINHTCIHF